MTFTTRTLLSSTAAFALAFPALAAGPLVTPVELLEMLGEGEVVALDVREAPKEGPAPYATGHVPGSLAAPMDMKNWRKTVGTVPGLLPDAEVFEAFMRGLGVDPGEQIVLIYDGREPTLYDVSQATRSYWTLKSMGHENVAILNGGVAAWLEAGLPLATTATAPAGEGTFTARFTDEWLVDKETVAAAIGGDVKLVDARPPAHYKAEQKHPKSARPGTLPGARSVYGATLMDGPRIKDPAGLKAMFDKVGVSGDDEIIAFCNSGFYCSTVWFSAHEVLGYPDVRSYDGSMIEWSQDESKPLVVGDGPSTSG